eukprot:scpid21341/ scgid1018/ 
MWTRDPRLTPLSEEEERSSSIFRRPSKKTPVPHTRWRGVLPNSPLLTARSAHVSVNDGAASLSSQRSRRHTMDSSSLASSSGSDRLASSSVSAMTNISTRAEHTNQVDEELVNCVNDALRHPVALMDMCVPGYSLGFAMRKAMSKDQTLRRMLLPQSQTKLASCSAVVRVEVQHLTECNVALDNARVYCLVSVGPTRTAAVPSEEETDVPDNYRRTMGATRVVQCSTLADSSNAVWNDKFEFLLPSSVSGLAAMSLYCYVWCAGKCASDSNEQSEPPVSNPTQSQVIRTNSGVRACDEPIWDDDVLIGTASIPLWEYVQATMPASQCVSLHNNGSTVSSSSPPVNTTATADHSPSAQLPGSALGTACAACDAVSAGILRVTVHATPYQDDSLREQQQQYHHHIQSLVALAWKNALLASPSQHHDTSTDDCVNSGQDVDLENTLEIIEASLDDGHDYLSGDGRSTHLHGSLHLDSSVRLMLSQCALKWHVNALQLAAMHILAACELCDDGDHQLPASTVSQLIDNLVCLLDAETDVDSLEQVSSVSDFHLGVAMIYDTSVTWLEENKQLFPPDIGCSSLTAIPDHVMLMQSIDRLRLKTGVSKVSSLLSDIHTVVNNSVAVWYGGDDVLSDDLSHETNEILLDLLADMQDVWHEALEICSKLRHAHQHATAFSTVGVSYNTAVLRAMVKEMEPNLQSVVNVVTTRITRVRRNSVPGASMAQSTAAAQRSDSGDEQAQQSIVKTLDSMALRTFHLYVTVDHFSKKLSALLAKSGLKRPLLDSHHTLFAGCISAWITAVEREVEQKVVTLVKVELDRVRTGYLKDSIVQDGLSPSALEAVDLVEEVMNSYWRPLQAWPQIVMAYTASVGLSDVLTGICRQYTIQLLLALKELRFFTVDNGGSVDVTLHGCVFLCNIQHVLKAGVELQLLERVQPLGQRGGTTAATPTLAISAPSFASSLLSASSGLAAHGGEQSRHVGYGRGTAVEPSHTDLDAQLRNVLDRVLLSLRDDLNVRLRATFAEALESIRSVFDRDVTELVKVTHKYTIDLAAQVVQPLLLHSSQLISQLICRNVPQTYFDCFLDSLWSLCTSCVHGAIKARLAKGMSRDHCQLAYDAVKILYGFYESCTERISLNTPQFKALMRGLELAQFTTEQLIQHYYYLDLEEQNQVNKSEATMGKFQLRMCLEYRRNKLTLAVNVMDCSGVNVLDKVSGSGDVCLRMELCPRHMFADSVSVFSARINSKSNQKFDMKIAFPVPEGPTPSMQNGVLHVTLIHREWFGIYETAIAQAVVPLHTIQRPIPGGPDLIQPSDRPAMVHLMCPTAHRCVVQVLQNRAKSEKLAQDFMTWHTKKSPRGNDSKTTSSSSRSSDSHSLDVTQDEYDLF